MNLLNIIYHHCSHISVDPKTLNGILILLNTFLVGTLFFGIYEFFKYKADGTEFWEAIFNTERPLILYIQVMTLFFDAIGIILYLGKLIGSWL